jgi:hypothetical protein
MTSIRNNSVIIFILTLINIFELYTIELTLNIQNLMLLFICITTSIYIYIIFNDLYFEIKNNLNLFLYQNYYPSNRKYYQYILCLNTFIFLSSSIIYCFDYWTNDIINETTLKFVFSLCLTISTSLFLIFAIYYTCAELLYLSSYYINHMLFNYAHSLPIFSNIKIQPAIDNYCWVCNKKLLKTEYTTHIHCPCNTIYHSKCIERYLVLYKNMCPNGHRIVKFKNEV